MSLFSASEDQTNSGLYSLLTRPHIYSFFQRLMGSHYKYRTYINEFMKPWEGASILDIGCGTADILDFLPSNIDYVGYDMSKDYIRYAKNKYGKRAKFFNERVNKMTLVYEEPFDIVLVDGLLHHLNDDESKMLFQIGYRALHDKGIMLTIDPTFDDRQGLIDRFITSKDRGNHVRTPEEYKNIANSVFSNIELKILKSGKLITLTCCIVKCHKQ